MISEHHLSVSRTARYATLGAVDASLTQVWFVCHGYGQLGARFLRDFAVLDDGHRLIVAPEGLSRFYVDPEHIRGGGTPRVGASWMTREDRLSEIADYLVYLDALAAKIFESVDRASVRVAILGFSQGVATACRWAALGAPEPARLILWAGGVPPDLDLDRAGERLNRMDLTLVLGTRDPLVTEAQRVAEEDRLRAAGVAFRVETFDGGHELNAGVLKRLAER